MKVIALAAKLVEVPDELNLDDMFISNPIVQSYIDADTAPYEKMTFVVPTRKGWFTFMEMRMAGNIIHNWVRKMVGQPDPVPSQPRQLWMTDAERDAYDESLK